MHVRLAIRLFWVSRIQNGPRAEISLLYPIAVHVRLAIRLFWVSRIQNGPQARNKPAVPHREREQSLTIPTIYNSIPHFGFESSPTFVTFNLV